MVGFSCPCQGAILCWPFLWFAASAGDPPGGVFLCAGLPLNFLGYVVAIVYGCGVCLLGIYFCMVLVKRVRAPGIPVCFYILLSRGELCVVPPGVFLWVVWLWDGVRVRGQLRCLGHVD